MDELKLATMKLADRYLGRRGEPPSVLSANRAAKAQALNDDDRQHLRWCIKVLRNAIGRDRDARAAMEFIEAVLDRDYALYRERRLHSE